MQRTQRVSSRRQTTTTAGGFGVCSNLCTHNKCVFFRIGKLFRFAKFTSENAIGSNSEAQKPNRRGNSLILPFRGSTGLRRMRERSSSCVIAWSAGASQASLFPFGGTTGCRPWEAGACVRYWIVSTRPSSGTILRCYFTRSPKLRSPLLTFEFSEAGDLREIRRKSPGFFFVSLPSAHTADGSRYLLQTYPDIHSQIFTRTSSL